jgi:Asp-tRNA(Asn)/Glu-tRNA(Gln) amidotransferase A subunit family amidase
MHNVSREIVRELCRYDALLTPTLSRPPMEPGTLYPNPERALEECLSWLPFTFPFNATGQPAISLPNGFTRSGLPIGLQIVGRPADEIAIIALSAAFEEARPWPERPPSAE